jgi:hypothetical protein
MIKEKKYVMLEFREFTYLHKKCLDLLRDRIRINGPDEICLVLEILCNKFSHDVADDRSWKRVPSIPPEILSRIDRNILEELIGINIDDNETTLHERVRLSEWDDLLSELIIPNDVGEYKDVW